MRKMIFTLLGVGALLGTSYAAQANSVLILEGYHAQAQMDDPAFREFSAERGQEFFSQNHTGGKPQTPSCTTCHTSDPSGVGQTRAGKTIAPLAISKTPDRYSDFEKVEKWFRRNCTSVLGRTCSAREKGDFITFMQTR
jgi:cytochrome c553